MTFVDVKEKAAELAAALTSCTGRTMVADVTVEEPRPPEDELHFIRLVNWGYVYFNEAGQPALREIARLLKSLGNEDAARFAKGKRDLEALRTTTAHNLPGEDGGNRRTRATAEAWLITHGGEPRDWTSCCRHLSETLLVMLESLLSAFRSATKASGDAAIIGSQLIDTADNSWPVHSFDEIVATAADRLKLSGLDIVAYRKKHQEAWRELAGMFMTREDARAALNRVIERELTNAFGMSTETA